MNKYEKARENFLKKIGIATDEYMNEIEKLKGLVEVIKTISPKFAKVNSQSNEETKKQ